MIDESKSMDEGQNLEDLQDEQSIFSFQNLFAMLVLNWQWFLLSIFICLCGALIYLRYAPKTYQVSAKMLIKDDDTRSRRNAANQMLANMQDLGFMSNSAGIENEVEILQSRILARDAVMDLKLYTQYTFLGRIGKRVVYDTQPVSVDIDSLSLSQWDKDLLDSVKSIKLTISRSDGLYRVDGETLSNGKTLGSFARKFAKLPATIRTKYGVLTFTRHSDKAMDDDDRYEVTILPPMVVATGYANAITVAPTSKLTSIAELTLIDQDTRRGLDYLRQLAICYNRQANADKNEIALKTEEFINGRLEKIDAELGTTEGAIENYKKRNSVTQLEMDATQSLTQSSQYETKLNEASAQLHLMDYLREYVDNPANKYKIIPSNVGMVDQASVSLISSYNQAVQERNRLLKNLSDRAPQVQTLTATLDDLQASIRTALLQARRSVDIQHQSLQRQLSKYEGRIVNTPEQERVLTQIGRQQEVKSGLYLLLLQKREENSISLAATADKGKLIDEPLAMGKVSPKSAIILLAACALPVCLSWPMCRWQAILSRPLPVLWCRQIRTIRLMRYSAPCVPIFSL